MSRVSLGVESAWVVESCEACVESAWDESGATQELGRRGVMGDDSWGIQPINRGVWLTFWHRFLKRRSAAILKTRLQYFLHFFLYFYQVLTSIED